MTISKFTRREFCVHSLQTASLAAAATAITACGGSPTSPGGGSSSSGSGFAALPSINASIAGNAITLNIDAGSPLATVGAAALVNASGRPFLVARTGQNTFTAMTAICTHEGCTVSTFQSQTFECPCHGSQYNTSGSVLKGPATRALAQFATSFANNVLTIATG
jgi:cytochrome b6-f complex iron-sulfur subunit